MAKTQKPAGEGPIKARVLCDCSYGTANSVVELEPLELANARSGGLVDDDPAAVAYAESLQPAAAVEQAAEQPAA